MKLTFLIVALILLSLQVIVAFQCEKGNYWTIVRIDDGIFGCKPCSPGYVCPGDDESYSCPRGSIAPYWGQSACTACPTKNTNSRGTACLLPDTPRNATNIQVMIAHEDSYPTKITLTTETQYFYTTIPFSTQGGDSYFATFSSTRSVSVFASWKSGAPSAANSFTYEMGRNISIPIGVFAETDQMLYFAAKLVATTGKPSSESVTFQLKFPI